MAFFKKKVKEQTDEEKALVERVTRLYKDAYNNKAELHAKWDKCFKAYNSDYFRKQLPDYKIQEVSNFVFGTIESVKPIMLANNPKFLAMPREEAAYGKSQNVQYAFEHEWTRTKMFTKLQQIITNGLIFGTSIVAVLWDENASRGIGEIDPIIISPFNLFTDEMATNIDDAEVVIYAVYKNAGQISKAFPEKAEQIKDNSTQASDEFLNYGKGAGNTTKANQVLYIECYMRDYTMEDETIFEENKEYKVSKMKYPNGRRIQIAGDVLLSDGENPYKDGKFPYVMWKCYDVPGQFFGIGEVEMIVSPMEAICELNNSIIENAGLMGNPIWIVDKNSGIEKNSLTNRKGLVVRKNPGTEARRETPPSMPAYIQNIVLELKSDIEKISGVYDVTRGEKPSGITAAAAIEALNDSAQGRIKLKVQSLEQMMSEFGSLYLSRFQQFWVTKRSIRIMGAQYIPNEAIQAKLLKIGTESIAFTDIDRTDVDGDFDITIVAGSTLPINKMAKLTSMVQLAQTTAEDGMPMVDRQTVLEAADIQNYEEVMQRFEAMKQQKAKQKPQSEPPKLNIDYSLLPPEGQAQVAAMAGIQLAPEQITAMKQAEEQSEVDKMTLEHEMDREDKTTDTDNQMTLQKNQQDIQSEAEGQDKNEQMKQIIEAVSTLTKAQLQKAIKENPELLEVLQSIAEQSQIGNSEGGI